MAYGATTMQNTKDADAMQRAREYWACGSAVRERAAAECLETLVQASEVVAAALRSGGKLMICGNGGSAADSQHLAAEFVSVLDRKRVRPGLAAVALTTDTSIITAIANDFGYGGIFERQVEALGRPGDVLLGISTSGNSECVVRAMKLARTRNLATLSLTGRDGGKLRDFSDVSICVPSTHTQHIQETHLALEHLLTALVEQSLFGEE